MTTILHIETATRVCSVAISTDGKLQVVKEISDDGYVHGEQLTLLIEGALTELGLRAADLSAVSVASGPGSYTGLRIGVSTAKGLCYALNIPLIAIDSLTALAVMGQKKYPNVRLCPLIDARRMEVYSAFYEADFSMSKPISADILDETSYAEFEPFVCFGDGAEKVRELWNNRQIKVDPEVQCSAVGQVELAFEKFRTAQFEDVAYFEPLYLKDFVVQKKGGQTT